MRPGIQGIVADRAQRDIDGVVVQAFVNGDPSKAPAATALSYAPNYRDGHGWFRLYGLKPGVKYQVRFTSGKTTDRVYKTVWSTARTLTDRQVVQLSTTTLTLAKKSRAKLAAAFVDATVKPSQHAQLTVTLTSRDVKPVSGDLWVTLDEQKARKTPIGAKNRGALTLKLPTLSLGTHKLSLAFGGNDAVLPSRKPVGITLRVTSTGR